MTSGGRGRDIRRFNQTNWPNSLGLQSHLRGQRFCLHPNGFNWSSAESQGRMVAIGHLLHLKHLFPSPFLGRRLARLKSEKLVSWQSSSARLGALSRLELS